MCVRRYLVFMFQQTVANVRHDSSGIEPDLTRPGQNSPDKKPGSSTTTTHFLHASNKLHRFIVLTLSYTGFFGFVLHGGEGGSLKRLKLLQSNLVH